MLGEREQCGRDTPADSTDSTLPVHMYSTLCNQPPCQLVVLIHLLLRSTLRDFCDIMMNVTYMCGGAVQWDQ